MASRVEEAMVDVVGRALVNVDGQVMPAKEAVVSVWDRGFLFGDAVFETLRFHAKCPVLWQAHFARLLASAEAIELLGLPSEQELRSRVQHLIELSGFTEGTIYIQVSRGNVFKRSDTEMPDRPTVVIAVDGSTCLPQALYETGVGVITYEDIRWKHAHLKTTNLLPRTLARMAARRHGAHEALFVGPDGTVFEGTSTNVFMLKDGILKTPPLSDRLLAGTTRAVLMQIAGPLVRKVSEEQVKVGDLLHAEEVLLCGTTTEVLGVISVDGNRIGAGKVGPVTKELRRIYRATVFGPE